MKSGDVGARPVEDALPPEPLPIVDERLELHRRWVPVARVRVRKRVHERVVDVPAVSLDHERVTVERVPVERFVDDEPEPRVEGDALVLPVVEERLVKRLVLREEIWIRRTRSAHDSAPRSVTLRSEEVVVERQTLGDEEATGRDGARARDRGGGERR